MTTVEQLIGNLLLRHNCVIIPSFGGFVAKPVPARIDYNKGTMHPPGKSLLFNKQLVNNDGLLISEFSQSNNLSYDEATTEIKDLVEGWRETLNLGGRIEIDNVGNLFFDDERNICFEQDRFCNLLLESFGLGTVHFLTEEDVEIVEKRISISEPEIEEEPIIVPIMDEPITVIEEAFEENNEVPVIPISRGEKKAKPATKDTSARKRKPWRYVAAACILPIAFYSVWIPVKTDVLESGVISYKDFNPFHQTSKGVYAEKELKGDWVSTDNIRGTLEDELVDVKGTAEVYPFKFTEDTYIQVALPVKDQENIEVSENVDPEPEVDLVQESFEANANHYIVGCFGDKTNADNLVAKLKVNGMDARIVDFHNGLHRVSAGGAVSEEAYQTIKLKADSLGLSGWRLK